MRYLLVIYIVKKYFEINILQPFQLLIISVRNPITTSNLPLPILLDHIILILSTYQNVENTSIDILIFYFLITTYLIVFGYNIG